jgi:hypothetical protein
MPRNLEVIYKEYCGFIPIAIYYQLMDKIGKQYHCIVIDLNDKSTNEWQDKVFWYKAPVDDKPFRFGSQASWDYNDRIVKEKAVALYEKMKREQQEKKEMALWVQKLNGQNGQSGEAKQPASLKRKLSDKYF